MIKFEGKVNKKVKRFLLIRQMIGVFLASVIVFCVLGIPGILLAINNNSFVLLIISLGGVIFANTLVPCILHYSLPDNICIEGGIITGKYKGTNMSGEIINTKQVFDYGDFYHITFHSSKWGICFCQKDLIVQGTIEEFEQLFQDKIVRKTKKV